MSRSVRSIIYFLMIILVFLSLIIVNLFIHVNSLKPEYVSKELVLKGTTINYPYYNNDRDIFIQTFLNEVDISVIDKVDYLINNFDRYTNVVFRLYDSENIVDYKNIIFLESNLVDNNLLINEKILQEKLKLYIYHNNIDMSDTNLIEAKKTYVFNESDFDIYLSKYNESDTVTRLTINYKELNDSVKFYYKEDVTYNLMEEIKEDEIPEIPDDELEEEEKKLIAFTFDDGPSIYIPELIEAFEEYDASATFFLVGYNVKRYPEIVSRLYKSGFELANHTIDHSRLTSFSCEKSADKIKQNSDLIFSITGERPRLFRPPYAAINNRILKCIEDPVIMWSVDPKDWESRNTEKIVYHILNNVKEGDIVLFHDLYKSTIDAVKILLPILYDDGYKLVSVSELFESYNIPLKAAETYRKATTNFEQ